MNSPAHDIALFLETSGYGDFGTAVFVGAEPTSPDVSTTIYDYPGGEPDTDELDVFTPRFQVRTRSTDYAEAYAMQEAVRNLLLTARNGIETDTSRFSIISLNSDIASLGRDGNQRYILVASYRARRTNKET